MTAFETATVVVGIFQIALPSALVAWGIWQMRRAGDQREKREDQRHGESMEALRQQHAESMEALRQQHAESMEALRGLIRGMETVIERTAK